MPDQLGYRLIRVRSTANHHPLGANEIEAMSSLSRRAEYSGAVWTERRRSPPHSEQGGFRRPHLVLEAQNLNPPIRGRAKVTSQTRPDSQAKINTIWGLGSPIQSMEFHRIIAEDARLGWLESPDRLHSRRRLASSKREGD
jgi:hypothetical protein